LEWKGFSAEIVVTEIGIFSIVMAVVDVYVIIQTVLG
jgi:hypothetical protein